MRFHRERQLALQTVEPGDQHAMLQHGAAAVAVYRGDLLPGMLDDWVLAEREQLRRQCIELCDHLVAGWRDVGDPDKALEYGRLRIRLEPLEEVGYRMLMELQADVGDRAGAISTFHKCAESLIKSYKSSRPKPLRHSLSHCSALTAPRFHLHAAIGAPGRDSLSVPGWWGAIENSTRSSSPGTASSRVGLDCWS
jgi:DNA-binding SARP family transcriptional activator